MTALPDHGHRVIAAVDAAARALGIAPGMTVTRARSLAPGPEVMDAELESNLAGLHRIALWAGKHYSPVRTPDPPDRIWLDITGCAELFDNGSALLKHLHRRMAATGVALQIAVADTSGAAHAVARHVPAGRPVTIEAGHQHKAIALLPIAALRSAAITVEGLRKIGFVARPTDRNACTANGGALAAPRPNTPSQCATIIRSRPRPEGATGCSASATARPRRPATCAGSSMAHSRDHRTMLSGD